MRLIVLIGLIPLLGACAVPSMPEPTSQATDSRTTTLDASATLALVNHSAEDSQLFEAAFCGGILVAPSVVLTASHCVDERRPETIDAVSGADDLCAGGYVERHPVVSVENGIGPNQSLALLKVEAGFEADPADFTASAPRPGTHLTALGWGRSSVAGVPPCSLRLVPLIAVSPDRCAAAGSSLPALQMVCSIPSGDQNTCDGDSGGPVIDVNDDAIVVVGVTVSGFGCGEDSLGVNALVTQSLLEGWLADAP